MTGPVVKKSQMTADKWNSLVDVLRRIDPRKTAAIIRDNRVTDKEMNKILDRNSDGELTHQDFASFQAPLFGRIRNLLSSYRFSAIAAWTGPLVDVNLRSIPQQFWSDKVFVRNAVKNHGGRLLKWASKALKKDRSFVLQLLRSSSFVLKHADMSLKNDRGFALAALKVNGVELMSLAASLKRDKEVVLAAVKQYGLALQYAGALLRKNKQVVLAAVKQFGRALEYADTSFKRDRDVVLAAVKREGYALKFADASLKEDKAVVLAAVKNDVHALQFANDSIRNEIILKALKQRGWRMLFEDYSYEGDYYDMSRYCWPLNEPRLNKYFTDYERSNRKSFIAALKNKYNIEFPLRFTSLNILIEVLRNRRSVNNPQDTRPLCIIIGPKKDSNKAFQHGLRSVDRMISLGYRVVYHEAANERDVVKYLKSATANGRYRAKTIILGGHGKPKSLALGADKGQLTARNEHLFIDTSDFKRGKDELKLARYLESDGEVFLFSCSTGKGGISNQANLVNTVSRTLFYGMKVHGLSQDEVLKQIHLQKNGDLIINYGRNVYVTRGKRWRITRLSFHPFL